jgi:hypothetical protein
VDLVGNIHYQGEMYCSAISDSLETATLGVTFAGDCLELCDAIERSQSAGQLSKFTQSMLDIANRAHKRTLETQKKFRHVRSALMDVSHYFL